MKKLMLIIFAVMVSISAVIILVFDLNYASKIRTRETSDNTLWIYGLDASTGFKIIENKHPYYIIKILHKKNVTWFEGLMIYNGLYYDVIELNKITAFDGDNLYLKNGENMSIQQEAINLEKVNNVIVK
ncbi:hypothetical protein ACU5DF_03555 [Aliivibrio wodanis]|uniref:hypothetical protein n=1 Tax=Aliivibrio wodanis TaxID=80852 RepID=UPI00406D3A17